MWFLTVSVQSSNRFCVFSAGPWLCSQEGLSPILRVLTKNLTKNLIEAFSDKLNHFSEGDSRVGMVVGFTVSAHCRRPHGIASSEW